MTQVLFVFATVAFILIAYLAGRYYGYKKAYVVQDQHVALWHGYSLVRAYVRSNALHKKRGTRLQDATTESILEHAQEELQELKQEPDDIYELADLVAILFHYMVYRHWTPAQLDDAIIEKLKERFDVFV